MVIYKIGDLVKHQISEEIIFKIIKTPNEEGGMKLEVVKEGRSNSPFSSFWNKGATGECNAEEITLIKKDMVQVKW